MSAGGFGLFMSLKLVLRDTGVYRHRAEPVLLGRTVCAGTDWGTLVAMKLPALVLATLLLSGCSPWVVSFEPASLTQERRQIVKKALRVPEGDLPALAEADGVVIGQLTLDVNTGWALTGGLEEVHEKAVESAAEQGATHFLYLAPKTVRGTVATANKIFNTTVVSARETTELRGANYLLIRVPRKNLKSLPAELRP